MKKKEEKTMSDIEKNVETTETPLIEVKDLKQYFNIRVCKTDCCLSFGRRCAKGRDGTSCAFACTFVFGHDKLTPGIFSGAV